MSDAAIKMLLERGASVDTLIPFMRVDETTELSFPEQYVELELEILQRYFQAESYAPHITKINLIGLPLETGTAQLLAKVIKGSNIISELAVGDEWYSLGSKDIVDLSAAIGESTSMCDVLIWTDVTEEAAESIGVAIAKSNTLEKLVLELEENNDALVRHICAGVQESSSFRSLRMVGPGMLTDAAMGAVAEALERCQSLEFVYIEPLEPDAVKVLARGVSCAKSLISFMTDTGGGVSPVDMEVLEDALHANRSCIEFVLLDELSEAAEGSLLRNQRAAEAFVLAAAKGQVEVMQRWLDWGVSINTNPDMQTAINAAVENKRFSAVAWLIQKGAHCPESVLASVRSEGWNRSHHWAWDTKENEALEAALVMNASEREVMFEIGGMDGYEATAEWWTLPDEVMDRVVGWLMDSDPSHHEVSWCWRHFDMVKEHVPDMFPGMLFAASRNGYEDRVRQLLDAGMDANILNEFGWTPLMVAAEEGHLRCVQSLLAGGADVHVKRPNGRTALTSAVVEKHADVVAALVMAGAHPESVEAEMERYGTDDLRKALLDPQGWTGRKG